MRNILVSSWFYSCMLIDFDKFVIANQLTSINCID